MSCDAAMARKHRIAMRNRQRTVSSSSSDDENEIQSGGRNNKRPRVSLKAEPPEPMVAVSSSAVSKSKKATPKEILESIKKKKPHITGIKRQSRYDPGVEMTKEELKAWRKEARRVRNRESAAASRKKNREAIEKLEVEVKGIQSKYDAALRYILSLEDQLNGNGSSSVSFAISNTLRQDLDVFQSKSPEDLMTTVSVSKTLSIEPISLEVDPQFRAKVRTNNDKNRLCLPLPNHRSHLTALSSQKHIIDNTIIRPIACV